MMPIAHEDHSTALPVLFVFAASLLFAPCVFGQEASAEKPVESVDREQESTESSAVPEEEGDGEKKPPKLSPEELQALRAERAALRAERKQKKRAREKRLDDKAVAEGQLPASQPLVKAEDACTAGVVPDDGTAETGYGFVPQVLSGTVVQRFEPGKHAGRPFERVCVCLMKTRHDVELSFALELFLEQEDRPASEAEWSRIFRVYGVADDKKLAGDFTVMELEGVKVPEGPFYLGVRWNPNKDSWSFLCADQSEREMEPIPAFLRENEAPSWAAVIGNKDYIFDNHKSAMIRFTSKEAPPEAEP